MSVPWLCSKGRFFLGLAVVAALGGPRRSDAAPVDNARAAPAAKGLILLIGDRHDPVYTRVRAELRSLGFTVETTRDDATPNAPADIDANARGLDAVAALRIDRSEGRVTLWMMDRASGHMAPVSILSLEPDAALVALRAVEALRTSLLDPDLLVPARPPPAALPAPPEERHRLPLPSPEITSASFGWSLGPAIAASASHSGPSWHAFISGHWMPSTRLGVEAFALIPITGADWSETEGSARFTFGMIGIGVRYRPIAVGIWSVDAGAGLGGALVHGRGTASDATFSSSERDTIAAMPFLRLGSRVAMSASLWLRADVAAAIALPRLEYTIADTASASWGAPLILGSIGVELGTAERTTHR
jgi:hypothetical protein